MKTTTFLAFFQIVDVVKDVSDLPSGMNRKTATESRIQFRSPLVQELRAEIASLKRDKERSEALWLKEKASLQEQIGIYEVHIPTAPLG